MVLTECNANWTCSLDDDEPWDMRFHFQGCDNLERTLCESDITYINMLAIIGIEGYDQKDSMYYVKQEGVGMAGMQLIKSEEDVEEMLELYEEKRCVTITVMKGRESEMAKLQINIGDGCEKQIPISEIGSPKVYNIDDAGVLYQSQTSVHEADMCAPVVSAHTEDSYGQYLFTQESCNVKKGKDIAGVKELDDFLKEFADDSPVVQGEERMEEDELMETEDIDVDSSEEEEEEQSDDADLHQKLKDLKRKRVYEGDSEPEDLFCEAEEEDDTSEAVVVRSTEPGYEDRLEGHNKPKRKWKRKI